MLLLWLSGFRNVVWYPFSPLFNNSYRITTLSAAHPNLQSHLLLLFCFVFPGEWLLDSWYLCAEFAFSPKKRCEYVTFVLSLCLQIIGRVINGRKFFVLCFFFLQQKVSLALTLISCRAQHFLAQTGNIMASCICRCFCLSTSENCTLAVLTFMPVHRFTEYD